MGVKGMAALRDVIRPGTARGLDFVVLDELRKRTGVDKDEILKFSLVEMLCNSLDTDASETDVSIKMEVSFDYSESDIGKLVRCRFGNLPTRLKKTDKT